MSFIKTGYSNWKYLRNTDKAFHQHESSNCHKQAIQRLIEILKSIEDYSEMIKSNSTEAQNQNRVFLIKIVYALSDLSQIISTWAWK